MSEIETIAYTFFNEGPQYAPGIDGNHIAKQISSIEAISRDSTICILSMQKTLLAG